MQSRNYTPHPVGWIETQLDEHHIDFLWKKIKESPKKSVKDNLIGNISQSFAIKDSSNFFYKKEPRHKTRLFFLSNNHDLCHP